MKKLHADRALIEHLHTRLGITPRDTAYDDQGSLIALDLSDLELEKVLTELGQLNNLRTLDLSRNRLREVPAELGQLTHLQRLYLNGNQLREVPAALGQLTNLQQLYVGSQNECPCPRTKRLKFHINKVFLSCCCHVKREFALQQVGFALPSVA